MKPFLAIRETSHALTHVYTETLAEANLQVANWLSSRDADPTRSVAIVYTPNDQLLQFKHPRPSVSRWLSAVRWPNRDLAPSNRFVNQEVTGWLAPVAHPATH